MLLAPEINLQQPNIISMVLQINIMCLVMISICGYETENEIIMSFILMLPVWHVVFMVPQGSGKASGAWLRMQTVPDLFPTQLTIK